MARTGPDRDVGQGKTRPPQGEVMVEAQYRILPAEFDAHRFIRHGLRHLPIVREKILQHVPERLTVPGGTGGGEFRVTPVVRRIRPVAAHKRRLPDDESEVFPDPRRVAAGRGMRGQEGGDVVAQAALGGGILRHEPQQVQIAAGDVMDHTDQTAVPDPRRHPLQQGGGEMAAEAVRQQVDLATAGGRQALDLGGRGIDQRPERPCTLRHRRLVPEMDVREPVAQELTFHMGVQAGTGVEEESGDWHRGFPSSPGGECVAFQSEIQTVNLLSTEHHSMQ